VEPPGQKEDEQRRHEGETSERSDEARADEAFAAKRLRDQKRGGRECPTAFRSMSESSR
jgi:hypothetical protein